VLLWVDREWVLTARSEITGLELLWGVDAQKKNIKGVVLKNTEGRVIGVGIWEQEAWFDQQMQIKGSRGRKRARLSQ